jgi:hypothetical protein
MTNKFLELGYGIRARYSKRGYGHMLELVNKKLLGPKLSEKLFP